MFKKITFGLFLGLILTLAPSCGSQRNDVAEERKEAQEASRAEAWLLKEGFEREKFATIDNKQIIEVYKAVKWAVDNGFQIEELRSLSAKQIIAVYEAARRGDRSVISDGTEIQFEPFGGTKPTKPTQPMGPHQPLGPRKPDIEFEYQQLQKKFPDHAKAFGVTGHANKKSIQAFQEAMERHIADISTLEIVGTFKKTIPVTHYVNPITGLHVMIRANGKYLSGWKLNKAQLENVLKRGAL